MLTTDQMDSTTPEERYKLVAMCENCAGWQFFTGSKYEQVNGQTVLRDSQVDNLVCSDDVLRKKIGCGGTKWRGLISQRTFDPVRAKKESASWLKKHPR